MLYSAMEEYAYNVKIKKENDVPNKFSLDYFIVNFKLFNNRSSVTVHCLDFIKFTFVYVTKIF